MRNMALAPAPYANKEGRNNAAERRVAALILEYALAQTGIDVINCLLNGSDLLRLLVRYLALEFFLEGHDQFHRIKRVGAKIVDEGGFVADLFLFDSQLFNNDFFDAFFNRAHDKHFLQKIKSRSDCGRYFIGNHPQIPDKT
jgi:hypothetical protein